MRLSIGLGIVFVVSGGADISRRRPIERRRRRYDVLMGGQGGGHLRIVQTGRFDFAFDSCKIDNLAYSITGISAQKRTLSIDQGPADGGGGRKIS